MATQRQVEDDHGMLLSEVAKQYESIFASKDQGMYLYLDDENRACNATFASWLGYKNPAEWAKVAGDFTAAFVDAESVERLVAAYRAAMKGGVGAQVLVTWKRKDGKTLRTHAILVPVDHEGHRFAMHYVTKV